MLQPVRCVLGLLAALAVVAGHAVRLAYRAGCARLGSTDEVEHASNGTFAAIVQRAPSGSSNLVAACIVSGCSARSSAWLSVARTQAQQCTTDCRGR